MTSYELSREWFDWCFENPEKINPNHTAIYFFAIEHCNRLGWKRKFGFPTQMAMDALGIKKHQTYIKYFNDIVEWGFFELVQKSSNQYSANIISLKSGMPKNGKALDKAIITHAAKQTQSNGQSNSSIDKQDNHITNNNITTNHFSNLEMFKGIDNQLFLAMCRQVSDETGKLIMDKRWYKELILLIANREELLNKKLKRSDQDFKRLTDKFVRDQITVGTEYKTYSDYWKHFTNWANKQP